MFCCLFSGRRPLRDALNDTFGIFLAFPRTGAVLAAAGMAFPLMVRAIRFAIEAGGLKLEEAGTTIGARAIWVFLTITMSLLAAGLVTGWFWLSPKL
jgi:molybdate transport system permease protein